MAPGHRGGNAGIRGDGIRGDGRDQHFPRTAGHGTWGRVCSARWPRGARLVRGCSARARAAGYAQREDLPSRFRHAALKTTAAFLQDERG